MSFTKCNEMIGSEKCGLDVIRGPCPNHKKIRALEKEKNSLHESLIKATEKEAYKKGLRKKAFCMLCLKTKKSVFYDEYCSPCSSRIYLKTLNNIKKQIVKYELNIQKEEYALKIVRASSNIK